MKTTLYAEEKSGHYIRRAISDLDAKIKFKVQSMLKSKKTGRVKSAAFPKKKEKLIELVKERRIGISINEV